jgi:microcystin-dependent protein
LKKQACRVRLVFSTSFILNFFKKNYSKMEGTMATILLFAGNFAPRNWGFCDGSIIAISTNSALFSLLGTTYGGNGTTNFALPDLRGRVAVGAGNGPGLSQYMLGQVGGSETVTLNTQQMPAHNHVAQTTVSVGTAGVNANADDPDASLLTTTTANFYANGVAPTGHLAGVTANTTIGISGGNQPVNIQSPYLALNYVICLYGIYPSRN